MILYGQRLMVILGGQDLYFLSVLRNMKLCFLMISQEHIYCHRRFDTSIIRNYKVLRIEQFTKKPCSK